tara:strand:- start:27 stop:575 length:549 start_codon:yes stop_codon:yes gene_type:complete
MAQYARPDADDTDGNWTDKSGGGTLYTSIDETSSDGATTYIKVTDNGSNEACIVRLSDVSAPGSSGTYIKYTALRDDNTGAGGPDLKIELLQGSSVKATTTNTGVSTSSWTAYSFTISDVSGISDWTDLKFRITSIAGSGAGMGAGDEMKVSQVYLETQDAGGGGSTPIAAIAGNTYRQMRG